MGRDTLDLDLRRVVTQAYKRPFSIASDFARAHKEAVAEAACLGLITVFHPHPLGTRAVWTDHTWRPTIKGLQEILDT